MQAYEWIALGSFASFAGLAWLRPLELRRRLIVSGFGILGMAIAYFGEHTGVFRHWLTAILLPMAYWQTGQFVRPMNLRLQKWLMTSDQRVLNDVERWRDVKGFGVVAAALELAYLLCYPLAPGAVLVLYALGLEGLGAQFWNIVLPSAFACYAVFPFVQTLPPRSVTQAPTAASPSALRSANLSVLRHLSIQANTFPSGHAAASMAVALFFLKTAPAAGVAFLVLAIGISAGAFLGRYHYLWDVVIGCAVAAVAFAVVAGLG